MPIVETNAEDSELFVANRCTNLIDCSQGQEHDHTIEQIVGFPNRSPDDTRRCIVTAIMPGKAALHLQGPNSGIWPQFPFDLDPMRELEVQIAVLLTIPGRQLVQVVRIDDQTFMLNIWEP